MRPCKCSNAKVTVSTHNDYVAIVVIVGMQRNDKFLRRSFQFPSLNLNQMKLLCSGWLCLDFTARMLNGGRDTLVD